MVFGGHRDRERRSSNMPCDDVRGYNHAVETYEKMEPVDELVENDRYVKIERDEQDRYRVSVFRSRQPMIRYDQDVYIDGQWVDDALLAQQLQYSAPQGSQKVLQVYDNFLDKKERFVPLSGKVNMNDNQVHVDYAFRYNGTMDWRWEQEHVVHAIVNALNKLSMS